MRPDGTKCVCGPVVHAAVPGLQGSMKREDEMKTLRKRIAAAIEAFRCAPSDELRINGVHAAKFAKRAYDLGDDLSGPGRYDMTDSTQAKLRRVRDWIRMAEQDALDARKGGS